MIVLCINGSNDRCRSPVSADRNQRAWVVAALSRDWVLVLLVRAILVRHGVCTAELKEHKQGKVQVERKVTSQAKIAAADSSSSSSRQQQQQQQQQQHQQHQQQQQIQNSANANANAASLQVD